MSKQKVFYRKMLLTYLGITLLLLGILGIVICSFVIQDKNVAGMFIFALIILNIISLVLFCIGGIYKLDFTGHKPVPFRTLLEYDYRNVGIPNNEYHEFKITYPNIVKESIKLKEISEGIYFGYINQKEIVFDMNGWLDPGYYIYEYLLTIIQLKVCDNDKRKLYKSQKTDSKDISISVEFINGKTKDFSLIKDGKTILSFKYKERMRFKVSKLHSDKIKISDLYNLG